MKILYSLLVLIFLLIKIGNAQDFARPDSEYVYDYLGGWSWGIIKISFEKDTVVDNRKLRKFERQSTGMGRIDSDTATIFREPIYFDSKDGVVEISEDLIHFDTIYNFRAPIGKKWKFYFNHFRGRKDSMQVEVLDTFRTNINGNHLFSQSVIYRNFSQTGSTYDWFEDTVIEEIGNKWEYFLPWDRGERAADGGEGGTLKCFKNNTFGTVSFENNAVNWFDYDCNELSNSGSVLPVFDKFSIYPNPFGEQFIIETDSNTGYFMLRDYLGKKISKIWIGEGKSRVDTQRLIPGIYFLHHNNEVYKIIKN